MILLWKIWINVNLYSKIWKHTNVSHGDWWLVYACTYICILCGCTIRLWCADSLIKSVWKYTLYSYDLAFTVVLLTKPLGKQVNRIFLIPKFSFYDCFRSSDILFCRMWNRLVGIQGSLLPQRSDQGQLVRGKGHYKMFRYPLSNVN